MAKKLTLLERLRAKEVSLVGRGANKKGRFPIQKQEIDVDEEMQELIAAVLGTEIDAEAKLAEVFEFEKAAPSPKAVAALKSALRIMDGFKEELPKDAMTKLAQLAGYPAPIPPKQQDPAPPEKDEGAGVGKNDHPDEVKKQLEAHAAEVEVLKGSNEALKASLDTMKDERDRTTWVAKAEKDLAHFPGKSTEELGAMLHDMAKFNAKTADDQFKAMAGVSKSIKESALLQAAGTGGAPPASGSPEDELNKMADELVMKSDADVDFYAAYSRVCKTTKGKALYAEMIKRQSSTH